MCARVRIIDVALLPWCPLPLIPRIYIYMCVRVMCRGTYGAWACNVSMNFFTFNAAPTNTYLYRVSVAMVLRMLRRVNQSCMYMCNDMHQHTPSLTYGVVRITGGAVLGS